MNVACRPAAERSAVTQVLTHVGEGGEQALKYISGC